MYPKDFIVLSSSAKWNNPAKVVVGVLLLIAASWLTIPLTPEVPITLQSMMVVLVATLLGRWWGMLTIVVYLLLGGLGLPIFAEGTSGFEKLFGTSAGFFIGFLAAAYICGWLAEKSWNNTFLKAALNFFIGHVVIVLCGIAWLVSFPQVDIKTLVISLLPGQLIKCLLGAMVISLIRISQK